jgi:hypothetical protein
MVKGWLDLALRLNLDSLAFCCLALRVLFHLNSWRPISQDHACSFWDDLFLLARAGKTYFKAVLPSLASSTVVFSES